MNKFLCLMIFCILPIMGYAQSVQVSGTVSDDAGAMPGVNIVVKGTTIGTITGINGNYTITVPNKDAVLGFSFVGYITQEITVGEKTVIDVRLADTFDEIEEVVVVGYGSMKKSDISGASVSVGEKQLKGSIITNLDQALQGRAAGVSSVMTSGAPGSAVSIRVRGQATINAGAEPLYVIDGVIVQGGGSSGADFGLGDALGNGSISAISPLSTINPSDILSMEILKDASATAIYGAQGSNGVVLITTKRGKAGEAKFSYEGMAGLQLQNARLKMMNLREFAEFSSSYAAETNGQDSRPEFLDPSLLGKGANWQDAVFQHAWMQQHQIAAQGGTDKVKYYVSGSYMDQDGTVIGTDFNRYSLRANLDADLKSWLKIGLNAMYSATSEKLGLANGEEGIINYSLLTPPDIPIYDIYGNYASTVREGYTRVNPIALAMMNDLLLDRNKLNGSFFMDITPIRHLTWHTELGFDIGGSKGERFFPTYQFGNTSRNLNESSIQRNNNSFWQLKNYVTYARDLQKHSFSAMLGQELWASKYDYLSGLATGLPSNEVHNPSLGSAESNKVGYGFGSSAMSSFFARATYNYDNRYMGTYTYRYDGSSNFGPKNRWAGFHAMAVSWRFSNEQFFEALKNVISDGKLRLGWGQTGNSSIPGYRWGSAIISMPTGLGAGYRQYNIANPYIKWETQEQWNLGLDLGFFDERIKLDIDLYDKTSADMLMNLQLPTYMGSSELSNLSSVLNPPMGNYGTINNKGVEIAITTRNIENRNGGLEWETDFQISFNKNKLVALDGTANAHIEGYAQFAGQGDLVSLTKVGDPLYNFYGYVSDGYYKDLADIQNSPKGAKYPADGVSFDRRNTVWAGDQKFKDLSGPNGTPDGVIDEYDRTNIGSPMPKFTFGMTNTFHYKNFDLSIFINGSYGNKIYNHTAANLSNMNSAWDNQLQYVKDRVHLEAINTNVAYDGSNGVWNWFEDINNVRIVNGSSPTAPRAIRGDPNDNDRVSDRYIEDGSYLRVKNITLGYTLPSDLTKKVKLDQVRVYTNIQNVWTITKYTGYDPEIGINTMTPNVFGLDYGRYPSPTVYTLGLNLSF